MSNAVAMQSFLDLSARDATGQFTRRLPRVSSNETIGRIVATVVSDMHLDAPDENRPPHVFHAFLEREGRHLRSGDVAGTVLKDEDVLVLQPDVQAG